MDGPVFRIRENLNFLTQTKSVFSVVVPTKYQDRQKNETVENIKIVENTDTDRNIETVKNIEAVKNTRTQNIGIVKKIKIIETVCWKYEHFQKFKFTRVSVPLMSPVWLVWFAWSEYADTK